MDEKTMNDLEITVDWLEGKRACLEGIKYFETLKEKDAFKIFEEMIERKENLHWANWAIVRLIEKPQFVAYAIYAAEQVLDIYEKQYPKDDRPRKAIEAAKGYLKNPSANAANAANAAANAANAANAAGNAANATEKEKMQIKILKYGMKLLKEKQ